MTGNNVYGQIGCEWTQQFGDDLPALEFGNGFVPEMMGMGEFHSCFVSTNGSMVCFGRNNYGQVLECVFYIIKFYIFSDPSARIRR